MFVFWNPCASANLHQQERALKPCSATLKWKRNNWKKGCWPKRKDNNHWWSSIKEARKQWKTKEKKEWGEWKLRKKKSLKWKGERKNFLKLQKDKLPRGKREHWLSKKRERMNSAICRGTRSCKNACQPSDPFHCIVVAVYAMSKCVGELPPHPVGYMTNIVKVAISTKSTTNQKMSICSATSKLRPLCRWATPNGPSRLLENTRQRLNKWRRP